MGRPELDRALRAGVRAALAELAPAEPDPAPARQRRRLGAGRAFALGIGAMTAGRVLSSGRARRWLESFDQRS
jgi:hypothetical protein